MNVLLPSCTICTIIAEREYRISYDEHMKLIIIHETISFHEISIEPGMQ